MPAKAGMTDEHSISLFYAECFQLHIMRIFFVCFFIFVVAAFIVSNRETEKPREQPRYEVLAKDDKFELRLYAPMLVAEAVSIGSFNGTQNEAYALLNNYMMGDNAEGIRMQMTAPIMLVRNVVLDENKVIEGSKDWLMRFFLSASFKHPEEAPHPRAAEGEEMAIRLLPARQMLVMRFSGSLGKTNTDAKIHDLNEYAARNGWRVVSGPTIAAYEDPYTTPPFERHNEVMFEVAK
jgi:hypothetical protein